jgi:hypothetical protein
MQILTQKNQNLEKPSRNSSNRTKVNNLKKKFFLIARQENLVCVCSVTAKMFEHRSSGENRRKGSEIFFKNRTRTYKVLI